MENILIIIMQDIDKFLWIPYKEDYNAYKCQRKTLVKHQEIIHGSEY